MDRSIKTEAEEYLAEMTYLSPPTIILSGSDIKIEDVTLKLEWIDNDNADDLHKKLIMDPVDHEIEFDENSTRKCSNCGFREGQYIVTRRQKMHLQLHKQCLKVGLICSHCGLRNAVSMVTRQQKMNINRHKLCPKMN